MDRDQLARLMLPSTAPRPTPRGPSFDDALDRMIQPEPAPWQGPVVPPQWNPTANAPFAGLESFTWKDPSQQPLTYGAVEDPTPPREYLQMLQLLGRRRLPARPVRCWWRHGGQLMARNAFRLNELE